MRFFVLISAIALYALAAGITLVLFGIVLPLFAAGYTVYKIPFVVREQLRFQQKIREIIDVD